MLVLKGRNEIHSGDWRCSEWTWKGSDSKWYRSPSQSMWLSCYFHQDRSAAASSSYYCFLLSSLEIVIEKNAFFFFFYFLYFFVLPLIKIMGLYYFMHVSCGGMFFHNIICVWDPMRKIEFLL